MDDPRVGTVLQQRYRIVAPLGTGGMGVVYRGERIGLGRPVAIKFLHAGLVHHKELLGRFEREAMAMSRLQHPHCVPVIDFGVAGEEPYIVLEYVAGRSLRDVMNEGRLPPARAVKIVRQVLAGLAHAHQLGLVHRDIKPANIMLADHVGTGDHARLLDFGLAKLLDAGTASWSTANVAVGTPAYMAPEQGRGGPIDARTDLYAVGVLLFELLTGDKPFVAQGALEVLRLHMDEPPPRLRERAPELPAALDAIVARALAKRPDDRFASAVELSDALAPVEAELSVERTPPAAVVARRSPRPDEAGPVGAASTTAAAVPRGGWRWKLALVTLVTLGALVAGWQARARWLATRGAAVEADAAVLAERTNDAAPEPLLALDADLAAEVAPDLADADTDVADASDGGEAGEADATLADADAGADAGEVVDAMASDASGGEADAAMPAVGEPAGDAAADLVDPADGGPAG